MSPHHRQYYNSKHTFSTAKNETEISQEIQQKIAISMIGSGMVEKQFIHTYLDRNPSAV